jgi:hypothetical protein
MRVDAAEGDALASLMDGGAKLLGGKDVVIAMVVKDVDVVPVSKSLKNGLGLEGVVGTGGLLCVDVVESGGMVDEDGGDKVPLLLELPSRLLDEARGGRNQLIEGDNVAGF